MTGPASDFFGHLCPVVNGMELDVLMIHYQQTCRDILKVVENICNFLRER